MCTTSPPPTSKEQHLTPLGVPAYTNDSTKTVLPRNNILKPTSQTQTDQSRDIPPASKVRVGSCKSSSARLRKASIWKFGVAATATFYHGGGATVLWLLLLLSLVHKRENQHVELASSLRGKFRGRYIGQTHEWPKPVYCTACRLVLKKTKSVIALTYCGSLEQTEPSHTGMDKEISTHAIP